MNKQRLTAQPQFRNSLSHFILVPHKALVHAAILSCNRHHGNSFPGNRPYASARPQWLTVLQPVQRRLRKSTCAARLQKQFREKGLMRERCWYRTTRRDASRRALCRMSSDPPRSFCLCFSLRKRDYHSPRAWKANAVVCLEIRLFAFSSVTLVKNRITPGYLVVAWRMVWIRARNLPADKLSER